MVLFLDNFTCWLPYPACLRADLGKLGPPHLGSYLLSTALFLVEMDGGKSPECCSLSSLWSLAQLWYLTGTWPNGFMQSDNYSPPIFIEHMLGRKIIAGYRKHYLLRFKIGFQRLGSGSCYERKMKSLPFIAMNAFAEPFPHNFTITHQKMQVFHGLFQE